MTQEDRSKLKQAKKSVADSSTTMFDIVNAYLNHVHHLKANIHLSKEQRH